MNIAAFFDLDGTLIPHPSLEVRFFWHALTSGQVRPKSCAAWITRTFRLSASRPQSICSAIRDAYASNKLWLSGISERSAVEWAQRQSPALKYFPAAVARIRWHLEHSHRVFVVTGCPAPLAKPAIAACRELDTLEVCATQLELGPNSEFTGETRGAAVCGRGKKRAVEGLAAQYNLDLNQSFAYANSFADRWVLAAVRHPFAINPDGKLSKLALDCGWPVVRWSCDRSANLSLAAKPSHPIC